MLLLSRPSESLIIHLIVLFVLSLTLGRGYKAWCLCLRVLEFIIKCVTNGYQKWRCQQGLFFPSRPVYVSSLYSLTIFEHIHTQTDRQTHTHTHTHSLPSGWLIHSRAIKLRMQTSWRQNIKNQSLRDLLVKFI